MDAPGRPTSSAGDEAPERIVRDVDKSLDAFRTISEVAADLDLPQHVLRFWETRFSQIKPLKRGGGRRYYRPDDVDLLRGIRHLLYGEGYTIRGVQRILKEQGVRFVMGLWQDGGAGLRGLSAPPNDLDDRDPRAAPQRQEPRDLGGWDEPEEAAQDLPPVPLRLMRGPDRAGTPAGRTPLDRARQAAVEANRTVSFVPAEAGHRDDHPVDDIIDWQEAPEPELSPAAMAQRFAPRPAAPAPGPSGAIHASPAPLLQRATPVAPSRALAPTRTEDAPTVRDARSAEWSSPNRPPLGTFIDRLRGAPQRAEADPSPAPAPGNLSRDEVRRLQATLFELLECKRLLDQAR